MGPAHEADVWLLAGCLSNDDVPLDVREREQSGRLPSTVLCVCLYVFYGPMMVMMHRRSPSVRPSYGRIVFGWLFGLRPVRSCRVHKCSRNSKHNT